MWGDWMFYLKLWTYLKLLEWQWWSKWGLKEECWRKCFWQSFSCYQVWVGILQHHRIFTCLRYCLAGCGERITSFCSWMIAPKSLSFFEKWGISMEPGSCLGLARASSQHRPPAGTAAVLLTLPQCACLRRTEGRLLFAVGDFFMLWRSYWKRLIWIFSSCCNSVYWHPLLFMNICALKGIADLKTSVKKAFLCEQEYWLSITQFFCFYF